MLKVNYGHESATARVHTRDLGGGYTKTELTVTLDRDPGFGPISSISPCANVQILSGDREDLTACAREFRKNAQYLTPGPGKEWHIAEAERLEALAEADFWSEHYKLAVS